MDRPYPPASLLEMSELSDFGIRLTPAPEVWERLQAEKHPQRRPRLPSRRQHLRRKCEHKED